MAWPEQHLQAIFEAAHAGATTDKFDGVDVVARPAVLSGAVLAPGHRHITVEHERRCSALADQPLLEGSGCP
jgi:hypothetical protein